MLVFMNIGVLFLLKWSGMDCDISQRRMGYKVGRGAKILVSIVITLFVFMRLEQVLEVLYYHSC